MKKLVKALLIAAAMVNAAAAVNSAPPEWKYYPKDDERDEAELEYKTQNYTINVGRIFNAFPRIYVRLDSLYLIINGKPKKYFRVEGEYNEWDPKDRYCKINIATKVDGKISTFEGTIKSFGKDPDSGFIDEKAARRIGSALGTKGSFVKIEIPVDDGTKFAIILAANSHFRHIKQASDEFVERAKEKNKKDREQIEKQLKELNEQLKELNEQLKELNEENGKGLKE